MKMLELMVEMTPNKEVRVNGRPLHYLRDHDVPVEEQVIVKNVPLDQQWMVLCELKKIVGKLEFAYRRSRINAGEVTNPINITTGAAGIPGTNIGKMPGLK